MQRKLKSCLLLFIAGALCISQIGTVYAAKELTPEQQAKAKAAFRAGSDVLYSGDGCGSSSGEGTTAGNTSVDCGVDADNDQGNKDKIWEFLVGKFKEQGYSGEEAEMASAGVMGNMWQETGGSFNPHIDHGMGCNSGPAIGLNQWCFSRQDNLKAKGEESGKGWQCLGVQLDFLWGEMETTHDHLFEIMKGKSPAEAAEIFDHGGDGASTGVAGFEESHDSQQGNHYRAGYADDVYKERTGKGPGDANAGAMSNGASPSASSSSSSSSGGCSSSAGSGGPVPEDCAALVAEFNSMHASGKLVLPQKANQDKDLANCTSDPVECGTGGKGGVKVKFLQTFITIIRSATGPVTLWNMNAGHGCDGLNHPNGRATDIPCDAGTTDMEVCKKMIDFAIDNKEELGLTEIIWQQNYRCDNGVDCTVGGHADHIHFGVGGA